MNAHTSTLGFNIRTGAFIVIAAITGFSAQRADARSDNRVREEARLVATVNGPLGASGDIEVERRRNRLEFKVQIEDVAVGSYDLFVDDVLRGVIDAAAVPGGVEGELEFRNPAKRGKLPLDFDPVGASIDVRLGGVTILSGVGPDLIVPDGQTQSGEFQKQKIKAFLFATDEFPPARGTMKLNSSKKKARLIVEATMLPRGDYDVLFDGIAVGSLSSNGKKGKVKFSTAPGGSDLPMGFDPVNTLVQIVQGSVVFLDGGLEGDPIGGGMSIAGVAETDLAPTADAPGASGDARFRNRTDRTDFKIEIEDVPVGDYAMLVGGVENATISVVSTSSGTRGEVEFRNPAEPGKILLDFDPLGAAIQIINAGGAVVLGGEMPTSTAGSTDDDSSDDSADDSADDSSDDSADDSSNDSNNDSSDDSNDDRRRGGRGGRGGR